MLLLILCFISYFAFTFSLVSIRRSHHFTHTHPHMPKYLKTSPVPTQPKINVLNFRNITSSQLSVTSCTANCENYKFPTFTLFNFSCNMFIWLQHVRLLLVIPCLFKQYIKLHIFCLFKQYNKYYRLRLRCNRQGITIVSLCRL